MTTLGVTGHRPRSLGLGKFNPRDRFWKDVYNYTYDLLRYSDVDKLISGGALGFDMISAKVAVDLNIYLELALPFYGYDRRWSRLDRERIEWLKMRCDHVEVVCQPGYAPWKYHARNHYIVDNSDEMLALYNGNGGGTGETVDYAEKQDVLTTIIDPGVFQGAN